MSRTTFRGYNRVKFPSAKLGKTVFCQSLLLRDYLLHLEWDDFVKSYELKPFRISYKSDERRRFIHPHVLIKNFEQQSIIVWLKSSVTDNKNHIQTIQCLTNYCKLQGFDFVVKFPEEIRKEPAFSNLKLLRRYQRSDISLRHTILCREFFARYAAPSLGDLIRFFRENNENPETVYALLSQKIVESDIHSSLIDADSLVTLKNQFPNFQNGRLAA